MHKVEKVDGGWSCSVEYRVETINADGDIMTHDMHDALDDALAAAVRAVAALAGEAVAVVVERAVYSVPTRAEARRLAADPSNEPSDLTIDYETVAHFGDAAALRAGEWVAADCTCPTCTRPTPPTTPTPTPRPTVEERVRADARVVEVSDERALGDGIFLSLARGLRFDGIGLHLIHEVSWSACERALREVRPCSCDDCTPPTTPTTDDAAQTAPPAVGGDAAERVRDAAERVAHARAAVDAACDDDAALDAALVRLAEVEALHAALVRLAEREAAEVETPRALWKAEADDLDRLPSLGSWLARPWAERAGCVVVWPTRYGRAESWLVVRGTDRGGPFMIGEEAVEAVEVRDDCGRAQRLGSALHLACVAAADARDAQGRAAAVVVVSADGQVRDLGRDADAAVRAYAQSIASFTYDRSASGISWAFDPHPARRFWAALGATA